jgi:CheY-like chemotaxis protein
VLRCPPVSPPDQPHVPPEESLESQASARKRRLVVVEDRQEIRDVLADLLIDDGFEVSTAADGVRGLELILSQPPDAALLDIGLPGIDGYELARRLRAQPSTANLPLLAMTGYGRAEDQKRAVDAGFDTHLVKPVNVEEVLATLARLGIHPVEQAP